MPIRAATRGGFVRNDHRGGVAPRQLRNAASRALGHRALGALLALLLGVSACGPPKDAPATGDAEMMSRTEYDLGRDLWLRQNKPREALSHALEAVELDSSHAEAAHLVALLYLDLCRRSEDECRLNAAEQQARHAVAEDPEFREARNTLGVILIHRHRYGQAIEVLKPLSQDILYETPENSWGNLGWAYLESGQLQLAVDALRRSVAAEPLFCVGNYRLGLAYSQKKQPHLAIEALTRALQTPSPECQRLQEAYAARARARLQLGQRDQARADLEACITLRDSTRAAHDCHSMIQKLE